MKSLTSQITHLQHERFIRLALPHKDFLFGLAKKLTGDVMHAEDLFQDTYLKAYRAFCNFDGGSRCRAWLKRIMINTYINIYNRRRKVIFCQQDDLIPQYPIEPCEQFTKGEEIDPDSLLRNLVSDELRELLLSLPHKNRMMVLLYDMLGFSYTEMAEIAGVPIGTVKSRLFRGRSALKEDIKRHRLQTSRLESSTSSKN